MHDKIGKIHATYKYVYYLCYMGIEISLLFPSAFLIGVEYFSASKENEYQELDFSLGLISITFIW